MAQELLSSIIGSKCGRDASIFGETWQRVSRATVCISSNKWGHHLSALVCQALSSSEPYVIQYIKLSVLIVELRQCNRIPILSPMTWLCFLDWLCEPAPYPYLMPLALSEHWAEVSKVRYKVAMNNFIGHSFCTCRIQFLAVPLFSCVTLGKLLNHSVPKFLHL